MAVKAAGTTVGERIIESLETGETSALEAVRKFVETVDSSFPDLGGDDGSRKKIINSAFKMTEQLLASANDVARQVLKASQDAASGFEK